jgi:hypothetical protein
MTPRQIDQLIERLDSHSAKLDQVDGVWTAGASDNIWGDPLLTGTGATRTDALLALTAALESR